MYPSALSNATVQKEEEEEKEDLAIPGTGRWFCYNNGGLNASVISRRERGKKTERVV
jgi:hypothetical protein